MKNTDDQRITLEDLCDLMARLRGEGGCPWDKQQTGSSIKIYLLEEAHELAEALDQNDTEEVKEELGDLLFQIIFLSQLYREQGDFDLSEVMKAIYQKMIRRHPHVFGDQAWQSPREVVQGWQEIKAGEKKGQDPFESLPPALPSLLKAHRVSQRAAGMGFEWADTGQVLAKVREELNEIEEALERKDQEAAQEELGDLLLSLVNLGRLMGVTAENGLRQATQKFLTRFRSMLRDDRLQDRNHHSLSPEEWEQLWLQSKKALQEK